MLTWWTLPAWHQKGFLRVLQRVEHGPLFWPRLFDLFFRPKFGLFVRLFMPFTHHAILDNKT